MSAVSTGWVERRQAVLPLELDLRFEACGPSFRDYFGFPFPTSVLRYEGGEAAWAVHRDEAAACATLLARAFTVPSFTREFRERGAEARAQLERAVRADNGSSARDRLASVTSAAVAVLALEAARALADEVGPPLDGDADAAAAEIAAAAGASVRALAVAIGCGEGELAWFSPTELLDPDLDAGYVAEEAAARRERLVRTLSPFPLEDAEMAAMLSLAGASGRPRLPAAEIGSFSGEEASQTLWLLDRRLALLEEPLEPPTPRGEVVYRASKASYEGTCRVITDLDNGELEFATGDVMVATATTPELVPLMRLAGAIVTDQGGATSHAAIIARELRIPCIVGTRLATSTLRSGQRIRLDLESGAVTAA